jgi:hypothetical protein
LIENEYRLVKLLISHQQKTDCRYYYACKDAKKAVIYVGGIGGGWDSPARELYPKLSRKVISNGISSLRIRYRHPTYLDECIKDVIAGIKFLENNRIQSDHIMSCLSILWSLLVLAAGFLNLIFHVLYIHPVLDTLYIQHKWQFTLTR